MAEQLVSKLKFKTAEYIIKDAWARDKIEHTLYSYNYDLTNNLGLVGITGDEIIFDAAVNAYKCKGNVTISVPHLGNYLVYIHTLNDSKGSIISQNKEYVVKPVTLIQLEDIDSISFTATDYIYINNIKVDEVLYLVPEKVSQLLNDAEYLSGEVENEMIIFNVNFNN